MNNDEVVRELAGLDRYPARLDPAPVSPAATTSPSFARRAAAYALDVLICATCVLLTQGAVWLAWGSPAEHLTGGAEWMAYMWSTVSAPVYAYFTLCESSARGATLGKRTLGLAVKDAYGAQITVARALGRTFAKLLPWDLAHLVLCFPAPPWDEGPAFELRRGIFAVYALVALDLAAALMTRRQQALHDLLSGTVVQASGAAPNTRG